MYKQRLGLIQNLVILKAQWYVELEGQFLLEDTIAVAVQNVCALESPACSFFGASLNPSYRGSIVQKL